jgi:glycerol kinase
MKSILALDQGTTGSTALVVTEDGAVAGRGYREFTQYFPRPGWVEHDAEEIWKITVEAATDALNESGLKPVTVGITNQRETVVVWDRKTGEPLHRALVWQDRRTAARCRSLQDELGDDFISAKTGLVWDPYFSGTKIEWLLENVSGLREKVEDGSAVFGTIDAWLVYRLTAGKVFATDHSNACRTMLYDLRERDWDPELLNIFGVPRHSLPEIVPSSGVLGEVGPDVFGMPMSVAGLIGDQQAALYGQGCWHAGQAKSTFGTGAFLLMNIGTDLETVDPTKTKGLLTTVGCTGTGKPAYALEGSIFVAGAAIQWLRDGLKLLDHASESEAMARSIEDSGGVYFVPALTGLGAPHWESEARGTIVGLTRGTERVHLVRAALESIAYGTRELSDTMSEVSGVSLEEMKVDGGVAANDWLMTELAGLLNVPVARPDIVETTALGAAGLAGLAEGVWSDPSEFASTRTYRRFPPVPAEAGGFEGWQRAVRAAVAWAREGS